MYVVDARWLPELPQGTHAFSAVGVHQGEVYVSQRGNVSHDPVLVLSAEDGRLLRTWGAADVATASHSWGSHGLAVCGAGPGATIWIDDFFAHTLVAFDGHGNQLGSIGVPGWAGNRTTSPIELGSVADTVCDGTGALFIADGDGGRNNRVLKVRAVLGPPAARYTHAQVEWATPPIYLNPHSLALHARSGSLVVADRDHGSTRLLRASDGRDLGRWDCGLEPDGTEQPFGLRFHTHTTPLSGGGRGALGHDLLFMSVYAPNAAAPERRQALLVLDASPLHSWALATQQQSALGEPGRASMSSGASLPRCVVLQRLSIDGSEWSFPHLLGVDPRNGDVYAALVADAPRSSVLRFRRTLTTRPAAWRAAMWWVPVAALAAVLGALAVAGARPHLRARRSRLRSGGGGEKQTVIQLTAQEESVLAGRQRHNGMDARATSEHSCSSWEELNPAAEEAAARLAGGAAHASPGGTSDSSRA